MLTAVNTESKKEVKKCMENTKRDPHTGTRKRKALSLLLRGLIWLVLGVVKLLLVQEGGSDDGNNGKGH